MVSFITIFLWFSHDFAISLGLFQRFSLFQPAMFDDPAIVTAACRSNEERRANLPYTAYLAARGAGFDLEMQF